MGSTTSAKPAWTLSPPSAYDIVAYWYPESEKVTTPGPRLRPSLVTQVLRGEGTGAIACRVVFGTKTLKIINRGSIDLIVQDPRDLSQLGLPRPTRFDLDRVLTLPWEPPFFGCWAGYPTPKIGSLTETYIREYAWLMHKRSSV
jgi:hypothetical protein